VKADQFENCVAGPSDLAILAFFVSRERPQVERDSGGQAALAESLQNGTCVTIGLGVRIWSDIFRSETWLAAFGISDWADFRGARFCRADFGWSGKLPGLCRAWR